jgi:hypothetical protein
MRRAPLMICEPASGFEPPTCRLQEIRPRTPSALAAPMARVIAPTALAALGLSSAPFHETFHADGRYWPVAITERRRSGLAHRRLHLLALTQSHVARTIGRLRRFAVRAGCGADSRRALSGGLYAQGSAAETVGRARPRRVADWRQRSSQASSSPSADEFPDPGASSSAIRRT